MLLLNLVIAIVLDAFAEKLAEIEESKEEAADGAESSMQALE